MRRGHGMVSGRTGPGSLGTHTHVPTADTQILPKGTGFVTDLGMAGPIHSVLGIRPNQAINRFLGGLPQRFGVGGRACKIDAVPLFRGHRHRRCTAVDRVDVR